MTRPITMSPALGLYLESKERTKTYVLVNTLHNTEESEDRDSSLSRAFCRRSFWNWLNCNWFPLISITLSRQIVRDGIDAKPWRWNLRVWSSVSERERERSNALWGVKEETKDWWIRLLVLYTSKCHARTSREPNKFHYFFFL